MPTPAAPTPRRRRLLWSALAFLLAALAGCAWLLAETLDCPLWLAATMVALVALVACGLAADAARGIKALWRDR
jgi:hypothetical protein